MKPEIAALHIDFDELRADIERNRLARLEYIDFKAQWLRKHAVVLPTGSAAGCNKA